MAAKRTMEEWSAMFDAADKDNNGYLSIQELAAKMRECDSKLTDKECVDVFMCLGGDASPAEVVKMMQDPDNHVTKERFITGMKTLQEWATVADELFEKFDKDGSGYLDASEVRELIKQAKKCSDAQARDTADKLFGGLDMDGDNKISKVEMIAALS